MEAIETCLESLNRIQHYLEMLLSDTSYDPRISTINHIKKLSDLCNEALGSDEVQALGYDYEELHPDLANKIIISCSSRGPHKGRYLSSCGVVIKFPGFKEQPIQLSRTLPVQTKTLASYDAIYEALSYFRTFGKGDARFIEIRTDDNLVAEKIQNEELLSDDDVVHRYESVKETLLEIMAKLCIPIKIVYYPPNSTTDLKQAKSEVK